MDRCALLTMLLTLLSVSQAQCVFKSVQEQGTLVGAGVENGFATKLITEVPVEVLLSCEGQRTILQVSPPTRQEDDSNSPTLKGPLRSYIEYMNETFKQNQQIVITEPFDDRPIRILISLENKGFILPASDKYFYQVHLTTNTLEAGQLRKYVLPIGQVSSMNSQKD